MRAGHAGRRDRPAGAAPRTQPGPGRTGLLTGDFPWWRRAVIYQVYVRSFADSDGDGIGDLPGVRSRLASVAELGVDAVWLTPFYPSPQADGGYDVSDHRGVDPTFGTLADFDGLVSDAHRLGLRVIIDIVPNHTSSEHPWFRAAVAAGRGSRERDRYLFRDGRGHDGDRPPNDWRSVFGGPAWGRVPDGQWYLHLFAPEQPDLAWTNEEVAAEFDATLRFWLDRGVDGFRIDVAHGLVKDPALPDLAAGFQTSGPTPAGHPHWDRDEVHDIFRRWRRLTDTYDRDVAFVGEAWVATPVQLARYVRPDELHTAFNFEFLQAPWDPVGLRAAIDSSIAALAAVGAPPTWVLSNHDVVRHLSRYGSVARARAAALLMLALPGGAYVYQGEELGLPEVHDLPDEVRQDPTFVRSGGTERGRDGCRVPLPWSGRVAPFGFGPPGSRPWLPQPTGWDRLTAERQADDPGSMRTLYRDALRVRRTSLGHEPLEWLDGPTGVLAFRRGQEFACVVNVGDEPAPRPAAVGRDPSVLIASGPLPDGSRIPGATAVWYRLRA